MAGAMTLKQVGRDEIDRRIAALEKARVEQSRDGIVMALGCLAEDLLLHRLGDVPLSQVQSALAVAMEGRKGNPALGPLLQVVERLKDDHRVVQDAHRTALKQVSRWRNAVAHSSTDPPPALPEVLAFVQESVWPMLRELGFASDQQLSALRDAAVVAHLGRIAGIEHRFDRKDQDKEVGYAVGQVDSRQLMVFFIDGEEEQGHGVIRARLRRGLTEKLGTVYEFLDSTVPPVIEWPTAQPASAARLAQLLAAVGVWFRVPEAPTEPLVSDAMPSAWGEWLEHLREAILRAVRVDPVLLVHRLEYVQGDDDRVLGQYLKHIWEPIATRLHGAASTCRVVLSFEVERVRPGFWLGPLWWRWRRGRRIADAIGTRIGDFSAPGSLRCRVPELGPVTQRETAEFLRDEFGYPAAEAEAMARDVWIDGGHGRFQHVVKHLRLRLPTAPGPRTR